MRKVEAILDSLWERIDHQFLSSSGISLLELMGDRVRICKVERTAPWEPTLQVQQPKKINPLHPKPNPTFKDKSESVEDAKSNESKLPSRTKIKTGGEADATKEESSNRVEEEEEQLSPTPQIFALGPRALKIARALYPSNIQDYTPGKVRWMDLVYLMYELKFYIRKHDGSEWYFEPLWMPDVPITIHEPHLVKEIPVVHLRRHARRLQDRYGWSHTTFAAK